MASVLLHPSLTDSRNTGAYVAWPRPGYHNIKKYHACAPLRFVARFGQPHKAISSHSVSRWLSKALRLAGIELGYSGHSTRGASTSAAAAAGLSVELILEVADWASAPTFECFYISGAFARAVLSS